MRMQFSKFAYAAGFTFALALTFGCTSDVEPPPEYPTSSSSSDTIQDEQSSSDGVALSSSSAQVSLSSSSGTVSSSSSQGSSQVDGNFFTDQRDGKKYKFEIAPDGKIWMSENLNYSRDSTLGYCYGVDINGANPHRDSTTCSNGYGRNYEWSVAMDGNSPQGLCPNGWHVPSITEWSQMLGEGFSFKGKMQEAFYMYPGNYNLNANYPPLGWKERDESGFYWTSNGNRFFTGFWQATKCRVEDYCIVEAGEGASSTDYFSVRCIANEDLKLNCGGNTYDPGTQVCSNGTVYVRCGDSHYNPSTQFCFGGTAYAFCGGNAYNPALEECVGGTVTEKSKPTPTPFTDIRDDKVYKKITIGTQIWMAENLAYNANGSKCYGDNPSNCTTYGKLYDWATAMALDSSCNSSSCSSQIDTKHRGICPSGWHIPSDAEWTTLTNFVGGLSIAGRKLKATSGWNDCGLGSSYSYQCEDAYGFSALPGGGGGSDGDFGSVGNFGNWWSASETNAYRAYNRSMSSGSEYVNYYRSTKDGLHSVRCVQD